MFQLLINVIMLCGFSIDPSLDKNYCAEQMLRCTEMNKERFDDCADLWEPAPVREPICVGNDGSMFCSSSR
jgi:hypothetical protein